MPMMPIKISITSMVKIPTFEEFLVKESFNEAGKSFILSPNGKFTWHEEHWVAASNEFRKQKGNKMQHNDFASLIIPTGKDLQELPFENFLKGKGYAWGYFLNGKITLFGIPKPTERQIKAVEDYALEHGFKSNIETFAARKIKFIS